MIWTLNLAFDEIGLGWAEDKEFERVRLLGILKEGG